MAWPFLRHYWNLFTSEAQWTENHAKSCHRNLSSHPFLSLKQVSFSQILQAPLPLHQSPGFDGMILSNMVPFVLLDNSKLIKHAEPSNSMGHGQAMVFMLLFVSLFLFPAFMQVHTKRCFCSRDRKNRLEGMFKGD